MAEPGPGGGDGPDAAPAAGVPPGGLRTRVVALATDPTTGAADFAAALSAIADDPGIPRGDRAARERRLVLRLLAWFGPGPLLALRAADGRASLRRLAALLDRDISELARLMGAQVDAVLHAPRFQKLEARWRGLWLLARLCQPRGMLRLRVMPAGWREVARDFARVADVEDSALFARVHNEEYDMPGGRPFGLLVGDYEVAHEPAERGVDDVATLRSLAQVGAAAFVPVVVGAAPRLLGLEGFRELGTRPDVAMAHGGPDHEDWRELRRHPDARYLGVALPRVLLRAPHGDDRYRDCPFPYAEDATAPDGSGYLWGNAAFAFAGVVMRAYLETGWFAEVRGAGRGGTGRGVVEGLPLLGHGVDPPGVEPRAPAEAYLSEAQERALAELGLVPVCRVSDGDGLAFYSNQSVALPARASGAVAAANARIATMLQYVLCVSRFVHYLKAMSRERVGGFSAASECLDLVEGFLRRYTVANDDADEEMKAAYPLRDFQVAVTDVPGKPGCFRLDAWLRPHYQLDQLSATFAVRTQLTGAAA